MLSRLRRGSLAYLSVGAGSYFALLTWRSVGEEAGWKLRSRANSNVQRIVSVRIQEQGRSRHKCLASCLFQKQQSGKRPVWRVARWLQIRGGYRRSRRRFVAPVCAVRRIINLRPGPRTVFSRVGEERHGRDCVFQQRRLPGSGSGSGERDRVGDPFQLRSNW